MADQASTADSVHQKEQDYIDWQNRSLRFYLAARLLFFHDQIGPSLINAQHCLALLLRATLLYWDESFVPESTLLEIAGMIRMVRRQVPGAEAFDVPPYFCTAKLFDSMGQQGGQNPEDMFKNIFLSHLDGVYYKLLTFVPYQQGSNLKKALSGALKKDLTILRRSNAQMKSLRKYLSTRPIK